MPKVATRVALDDVLDALTRPGSGTDAAEQRVLDAAGALLRSRGLAGVEVELVAARSKVGRSTIYRHFDGRNALIAATVAHEARRLLTALAEAVDPSDPVEDQLAAVFAAGIRMARLTGLADLVRSEPLLLRLLTVDAGPIVVAAAEQLVELAAGRDPDVDRDAGAGVAELLVRLAISFVVTPRTTLPLGAEAEETVRTYIAPLLRATP